jgi:hypothetical protein
MVLASLKAALGLLRSPSTWLPGIAFGLYAGSSFVLQASAGLFIAERLFILEMVTVPFFVAGLLYLVKTGERAFPSFASGGISGYFRVLLPSMVLIFAILITILLILIPLMIIGIAEAVLPFMALSVSITILFFTSFYDAAAIIEDRKVFDSLRRSVEFVLHHARDCVIFYLMVIIISSIVVFGLMVLWTAALYDRILPLASFNATQVQTFTIDQFNALLGTDGLFITAFFLFIGLTILVAGTTCFKACFFRDRSPGPAAEPLQVQQGEYDHKGRYFKY